MTLIGTRQVRKNRSPFIRSIFLIMAIKFWFHQDVLPTKAVYLLISNSKLFNNLTFLKSQIINLIVKMSNVDCLMNNYPFQNKQNFTFMLSSKCY